MALPAVYKLDAAVVESLNACLRLERTVCEGYHDQERSYKLAGWCELREFFDRLGRRCRCRRRALLDWLFAGGAVPDTASDPYKVADPNDPEAALKLATEHEVDLYDAYADLIKTCMDAGDFCSMKLAHELMLKTRKSLESLAEEQNVLAKLGAVDYLSSMR